MLLNECVMLSILLCCCLVSFTAPASPFIVQGVLVYKGYDGKIVPATVLQQCWNSRRDGSTMRVLVFVWCSTPGLKWW
jgi:hypothetical protein